ncbi:chondroitin AC/alginate lyase [Marasmius fiardii PR-910]|nr:chondroitin AC/alginate lyase [Marasmius fiardii PR-910]
MVHEFFRSSILLTLLVICCVQVQAASSYINEFVDPKFIAAKQFDIRTNLAGITILRWANQYSKKGPWSVTNSTVIPPSGDRHDYMSWMSNTWPNCTAVNNVTLTEENKWKFCPYVHRIETNPDTVNVNAASVHAFNDLANAVLYNAIGSVIARINNDAYSRSSVSYLQTWFLDPEKRMNPNLNYAQMKRGPKGQLGHYGGILQLRAFVKIASGILILRESKSSIYTPDIDQGMIAWCNQYIQWLRAGVQGARESLSVNYHGTFYSAQLAALQLIVNDRQGAINTIDAFFNSKFMNQIDSTGEQPLEWNTTHVQHYRTLNLGALSLVRMAKYANSTSNSYWNKTTSQGGTIQSAVDFAMTQALANNNSATGPGDLRHLEPLVAAAASTFGDPDKKYETFLLQADPTYAQKPYFFWNQPLSGGSSFEDHNGKNGTGRPRAVNASGRVGEFDGIGRLVLLVLSSALAIELLLGP